MNFIFKTDKELVITYSWSSQNHAICGHTFEVLDYYLLLKEFFDIQILFTEDITWKDIEYLLLDRYNLSEIEIKEMKKNTVFKTNPKIFKCKNILFVDGGKMIDTYTLLCENVFIFACGPSSDRTFNDKYITLLDTRIYSNTPNKYYNYKKKLFFAKYKKTVESGNKTLIYATENCRKTDKEFPNMLKLIKDDLPYLNLFNVIDSYYYTPVPRKFDCSSRLLAECKYYKKKIIFDKEVLDYFEEDKGLFYRWYDIENDFESLFLTYNDSIIDIFKEYLR